MIDLKLLRQDPERFRLGAQRKDVDVDIDRVLQLDAAKRARMSEQEALRAQQRAVEKELGPSIGKLNGAMNKAQDAQQETLRKELEALRAKPVALKDRIQTLEAELAAIEPELQGLLLRIPLPPDHDVPVGAGAGDNVEIERWDPEGLTGPGGFENARGFEPKAHLELLEELGIANFERGVKVAGARSYTLCGAGAVLHHAVLRYAHDTMVGHGFEPVTVPVVVREPCMVGTGFFPGGREQAYHIEETRRGGGHDLYLAGTGEVGLMGMLADEILDAATLPLKLVTLSTCFRREAGAAGRDAAGLYRIHQFEKVEQVVICRADQAESRAWHRKMLGYVREMLESLGLPHRLLQCCTGDLGVKNADMVDVECWMPGRGELGKNKRPAGAFGETHSASRLYDYQCRRLNLRARDGKGKPFVCHSLNNTVAASPRFLIPLLEIHQQRDGAVDVPEVLRPYAGGIERIEPARG